MLPLLHETVSSTFKDLIGHCNHSISIDAKIMVSKYCPIIGEHAVVNSVVQQVTIAAI